VLDRNPSTLAKEVFARVDLLQATRFIADSWRKVSTKTIQNCFALGVLNTQGLEMHGKVDSENDIFEMHHIRN
jgi:hypothetical protein